MGSMLGAGGGRLFAALTLFGVVLTVGSVSAVQYLAANVAPPAAQFAQGRTVKQSIASLKSVLDPMSTGSVSRIATPVVLDPCTGARKN
ncbi:hypothetical protein SLNSH_07290 [Alsobacter soli]|uniref:Uncharacterized protein n=1 Tax=Alsobacter soli TaxID=2109933 RepID=A0A2T1HVW9_9HYPH|nr:hypothetical protein [Alsobacter soli]PSC05775.1 hypothetical protein SLNSH_07290 [Alsobacter soli]